MGINLEVQEVSQKIYFFFEACDLMVRTGRLELPHLTVLASKTSVSTNSTTSAYEVFCDGERMPLISIFVNDLFGIAF